MKFWTNILSFLLAIFFAKKFTYYFMTGHLGVNVTNKRMRVCNDVTARFIISYRSLQCTIIHLHWKLHKGVVEFIARGVLKKKCVNTIVFYVYFTSLCDVLQIMLSCFSVLYQFYVDILTVLSGLNIMNARSSHDEGLHHLHIKYVT